MSTGPRYTIFAARAVFDERLTHTDLRVLAALGSYTDKEGWCHPSQAVLADRLQIGRQKVSDAINTLTACGYVHTRARTASGRGKVGNEYRVVTDLPDLEKQPMSSPGDIGPMSPPADVGAGRQRKARKASAAKAKPMSAQDDNGADVAKNGGPMSPQDDIAYRRTTPIERPQYDVDELVLTAPEPKREKSEPKASRSKAKFIATDKTLPAEPTPEMYASALKYGFVNGSVQKIFDRWRNWHIGKGTEMAVPNSSFAYWVSNVKGSERTELLAHQNGKPGGKPKPSNGVLPNPYMG